jgi:hypothetical protein
MSEMRALSVRQPWAWAIACAGKTVENRTRGTRYRGLLAIHASKTVYRADLDEPSILTAIMMKEFEIDEAASRLGAVVAVADLTGCHGPDGCTGTCSPWAVRGQHHWNLHDVRPLPEPVSCKGALGLWRLPEDVERAVCGQLVDEEDGS